MGIELDNQLHPHHPSPCWSVAGFAFCPVLSLWKGGYCFAFFFFFPPKYLFPRKAPVPGSHNLHQTSALFLVAQSVLNALFSAPEADRTMPGARCCRPWLSSTLPALSAGAKPLRRQEAAELPSGAHSSGSPEPLCLTEAKGEGELSCGWQMHSHGSSKAV